MAPLTGRPQLPENATELEAARRDFGASEPRELFYRISTVLIDDAWEDPSPILSVGDGLAILLMSWNSSHYRYRPATSEHIQAINELLDEYGAQLRSLRHRQIAEFTQIDAPALGLMFGDFEGLLGPVGAAKALHLLAPGFFPIWDRRIADTYGQRLGRSGSNRRRYLAFVKIAKDQCRELAAWPDPPTDPVKALDEWNYVKITLPALAKARAVRQAKRQSPPRMPTPLGGKDAFPHTGTSRAEPTLRHAMTTVLRAHGGKMKPRALVDEINARALYRQRAGGPVPLGQIHSYVGNYPDVFRRESGWIALIEPD